MTVRPGMLVTLLHLRRHLGLTNPAVPGSHRHVRRVESPVIPAGTVLDDYTIAERIGVGGFGEVYRATHRRMGGDVAIKLLHGERCGDKEAVARFIAEARAANKIRHPGIVDVFDFGTSPDGRMYFVMALLRGATLRELLDEAGRLVLQDAIPILRGIAAAIDAAHAAGVAHRDLKPANVFVQTDGTVKLIDFGLAKLADDPSQTATGAILGTPLYMAPEQYRGRGAGMEADLYSFGAVAYHALTGAPPFLGDAVALAMRHLKEQPERPSRRVPGLPAGVDDVLGKLLAKDPGRRPRPLAPAVERMPARFAPRRYIPVTAASAVVLVAALGASLIWRRHPPSVVDPRAVTTRLAQDVRVANIISMTPDGSAVEWFDGSSLNKMTIGSEPTRLREGAFYVSEFPDGTQLENRDGGRIRILDRKTGVDRLIAAGNWPEACPLGGRFAMFAGGRLAMYDLATASYRDLGEAPGASGVRWSPDCRRLVWASPGTVHITDAATATSSEVPIRLVGYRGVYAPAAFYGQNALVYCGRDGDVPSVRVHYLDGRAADVTLARLPVDVELCRIATSADGKRTAIAIRTSRYRAYEAALDASELAPQAVYELPEGPQTIAAATYDDDDRLVVETQRRDAPSAAIVEPHGEAPQRTLVTLASTPVVTAACAGSAGALRRGAASFQAVLEPSPPRFALLDRQCQEVASLPLPASDGWTLPSCARDTCVAARLHGGRILVYALGEREARELASLPQLPAARDAAQAASIAISPDARRAVVLKLAEPQVHVVPLDGGEPRTIRVGDGIDGVLEQVIWSADPDHFYSTGNGVDGGFGVLRFGVDGSHEKLWDRAATSTFPTIGALSRSGKRLAFTTEESRDQLLVLEMPRP